MAGKSKNPGAHPGVDGRPPLDIDVKQLAGLAMIQCTIEDAALFFRCSRDTIKRRLQEPEFRDVWEQGRAGGRISLRRLQWQTASGKDNKAAANMQQFLGKHWLGQTEKSLVELGGKDGGPIKFDFSRLDSLSVEELKVLERVLEKLRPGPASAG